MSRAARARFLGFASATLALAILTLWAVTLSRNAWQATFPNYITLHKGNLVLISSLWQRSATGTHAAQSTGWIYTASIFFRPPRAIPAWVFIGNAYDGTPPYIAKLHAAVIPAWLFALPPAFFAWRTLRRPELWRPPGHCPCGYDRAGLGPLPCPECGRPQPPT